MAFNRYNKSGGGGGFRSGGFKGGGFKSGEFRGGRDSERTKMHDAVCDNCGKNCEVPFRPTSGKPVFCSSCFENKDNNITRRPEPDYKEQFDALNTKLDNILKLLAPEKKTKASKLVIS